MCRIDHRTVLQPNAFLARRPKHLPSDTPSRARRRPVFSGSGASDRNKVSRTAVLELLDFAMALPTGRIWMPSKGGGDDEDVGPRSGYFAAADPPAQEAAARQV